MLAATLKGVASVPRLSDLVAAPHVAWPRVSIIIPACDEARSIEAAMRSVLAQRYPALEVVAVNDRSTDGTGEVLERLAANDARLRVVHVRELPEGWLGKLNALKHGVAGASGDWLLFADADVHLDPETLQKTLSYAELHAIDFISVLPEIASAGFWGDTVFNLACAGLCLTTRPWRIKRAETKNIAATGAFMLVRREAFQRTPGFDWLKLEVADDFGLCLMIKTFGGRCELLNGAGEVKLTWYESARDMANKLQKNFFAITGRFSLARLVAQAVVMAWLAAFPLALVLGELTFGRVLAVSVAMLLQLVNALTVARWTRLPLLPAFFPQVGLVVTAFMQVRAGVIGWRQGGIRWRGVLYSTELLRAQQRVRL